MAERDYQARTLTVRAHRVRAPHKRQLGRTPMYRSRSHRLGATIAIALTASLAIAIGLTAAARTAQAASGTITVAYSKTYVFDADPLSVIWWDNIKKQFEETYKGAHLELQGYDGTDVDLVNKVALLYKSASTTPDV